MAGWRILDRLRGLRTPAVGERVWFAKKRFGGVVTEANSDGSIVVQGGPIIRNSKGRQIPQFTTAAHSKDCVWNPATSMWVHGKGPTPKNVRGQVIRPEPIQASGRPTGSFAVTKGGNR